MFGKKNKNRKKNEKEEPNISDLLDSPNFEGGKTKKNLCIKRSKFVGLVVFLSIVSAVIGAFCAKFLDRFIFDKYYNFPRELHIEGDTCGSGEAVGLKASLSVVGIKCEYVNKGSSGAFLEGYMKIFLILVGYLKINLILKKKTKKAVEIMMKNMNLLMLV